MPSTFAPAGAAPSAPSPVSAPASSQEAPTGPVKPNEKDIQDDADDSDLDERSPLSIADFHALFAISPALLGQHPNIAAVERMYAIAPQDSDSDSEDYDSDTGDAAQQSSTAPVRRVTIDAAAKKEEPSTSVSGAAAAVAGTPSSGPGSTGVGAGKHPRLSRSRASSFYGINRPIPVSSPAAAVTAAATFGPSALGKGRFVIDPSSRHGVPEGHPSVPPLPSTPQALLPTWLGGSHGSNATNTGGASGAAAASNAPSADLSPKSLALRNSLFPELASGSSNGAAAVASSGPAGTDAHPDGNSTSTDAGDSDSDDESKKVPVVPKAPPTTTTSTGTGLKIKFGGGTVQGANQPTGPSGQRLSGSAQGAGAAGPPDRETGRKLWEVVDSVGLLDGVLPP